MIPRHCPPFSLRTLWSAVRSGRGDYPRVADLERAYAAALEVPEAVLLPSVRAGIYLLLKATLRGNGRVVGPAYTCPVVWEAAILSEAAVRPVDTTPGQLLPAPAELSAVAQPDDALVLCELYGIPSSPQALRRSGASRPQMRILDMAMSIPEPARLRQMDPDDVALFSFGIGKCMYAGSGGIACLADREVAGRLRESCDRWVVEESLRLRVRHGVSVLLRVALHNRRTYRVARAVATWRNLRRRLPALPTPRPAPSVDEIRGRLGPEWREPMTTWNRRLALHNLRDLQHRVEVRRRQAERYYQKLGDTGIVRGMSPDALPQSHFPVNLNNNRFTVF